ncbi:BTAD domain-containing putative transcriptional regulator [Phytohabitans sp. LJ34]|uniref:BTAD domain-containing putative transcriptional regulator n=1 Tax=Phytohabitans sp. LJ34 TaxID=3452217 RepID=UPI003F8BFA44
MISSETIAFRVLGPLEVHGSDRPLAMPGLRQRALLARLLVENGRTVPVHRLVGDLWDGDPPAQAIATIQTFVSRLRRAIEPDRAPRAAPTRLVTVAPGYALRAAPHEVDAWHFTELVRSAATAGEPAPALAVLDEALALWRGPAYAEFATERWAQPEVERLTELHRVAAERRADALIRLGRARELIADLEAQAVRFPLREEGWRLLALARYACGRQGDALAALRQARQTLREHLGVDPGPALRQLESDILAQATHLTLARPMPPPTPPSPPAEVDLFVGRDVELDRVLAVADRPALQLVLVTGETGAGKSRLAREVADRLRGRGWTVGQGRCAETDGMPPGWAWIGAVRSLAEVRPPDPAVATQLGWLLADESPAGGDPLDGRHRIHRALGEYLLACGPLLLVLDDVHRLDEETLALIAGVLHTLRDSRSTLLFTVRDGESSTLLDELLALVAAHHPERVELRGLPDWAVSEIVAATCSSDVDSQTLAAIAERTSGNPFFVRETARLLESDGPAAALSVVPAGVRDVVRRRVSMLPATARTVLVAAAVLDHHIGLDALAEVSGADEESVLNAVEAALMVGLLVETGPTAVAFPHALVREALYESVPQLRRGRLHARAATALEHSTPHDVATLAHHFEAANSPQLAASASRYAALAAEEAQRRYAYRDADRLWQKALAARDRAGGTPTERLRLLLGRVHALAHAGELVAARALRDETLREAAAVDDPLLTARVLASFDVPTLWTNRPYGTVNAAVIALTTRTLARLPDGDSEPRGRLLVNLALELEGEDDPRGRAAATEAEAMARRLGDPHLLMMALNATFLQSYSVLDLDQRVRAGDELLHVAAEHRLFHAEILGRMALAGAHTARADLAAAAEHVEAVGRLATTYEQPLTLGIAGCHRALLHAAAGRHDEAEAAYLDATRRLDPLGRWGDEPDLMVVARAMLAIDAGRAADVPRICLGQTPNSQPELRTMPELRALALALAGDTDASRATIEATSIRRDYVYDLRWTLRALHALATHDLARARAAYQALLPLEDLIAGGTTANVALGPIAHVLADLAGFLALPADAHYERAARIAGKADAPLWHERARAHRPLLA